jgi:hypothetical protein
MSALLRAVKCLGAVSVALFYLLSFYKYHLDLYYFLLFLFPIFLLLGHIIADDLRRFRTDKADAGSSANLKTCYSEIFILFSGPVAVVALEIAYFQMVGGLEEFLYGTFVLPFHLDYYRPMDEYRLGAIAVACLGVSTLILAAIASRWRGQNETAKRVFWAGCLLSMVALTVAPIASDTPLETVRDYSALILSPLTLLLCSYALVATWRKEKVLGGNTRETLSLALVFIIACQGLIMSFPRTDAAHIQINNTTVFILISFLLWRMHAGWISFFRDNARFQAWTSVAAGVALVATALVWSMKTFLFYAPAETRSSAAIDSDRMMELDFPRSKGLSIPMWYSPLYPAIWQHISLVTNYIVANTSSDDSVFLLCELQMIHFLADRDSAVMKEYYFVHLAAQGLIDRADDVRLTDDQLLGRLIEARPRFIVQTAGGEGESTKRIASIWPGTYSFIRENYRVAETLGVYEILQERSARPGARDR